MKLDQIVTLTIDGQPLSQEGYYPYNKIDYWDAVGLAEDLYSNKSYTSNILTGAAWDRTLNWIYETGGKTLDEIREDSTSWGNYKENEFEINKGEYSEDYGTTYIQVSGTYKKVKDKSVLLTTGATDRNKVNNIFDLAGNVEEWTLEYQESRT